MPESGSMKQKISVVINTYNAEKYLTRVLDTVKEFDEIVVCDMESTDRTRKIANQYGCNVVVFPKGDYNICEPARNFAIQSASCDWVLVVDADELITPELHDYLYRFIQKPDQVKGLYIPRKNFTMGRFLPSDYPDYQLRFFVRVGTDWPKEIHSRPVVSGKTIFIEKRRKELAIVHLDDSTNSYLRRLTNYTDNEVVKRNGQRATFFKFAFYPTYHFFKYYILKGGIRFGVPGFVHAVRKAIYKFTTLCKLYEIQHKEAK